MHHGPDDLDDDALLRRLSDRLADTRRCEADLVADVGEVDRRRLYARHASPSMYAWCTHVLHQSEAEAYLRIAAARAARRHPSLLEMLRDGRLHLSGIARLVPHLDRDYGETLLARAVHLSRHRIDELIVELAPRPDVPDVIRRLPQRAPRPWAAPAHPLPATPTSPQGRPPAASPDAPASPLPAPPVPPASPDPGAFPNSRPGPPPGDPRPASAAASHPAPSPSLVEPLSPARFKVQFTASAELHHKLRRLQALMTGAVPDGDLATLIDQAVTEKLERLESRRFALTPAPRKDLAGADTSPASRYIPAPIRRAVYERDGGQCRYVDAHGRRCPERDRLEFHHQVPFAHGGEHRPSNLRLMCPAHNAFLAERDYGRTAMDRHRAGGQRRP